MSLLVFPSSSPRASRAWLAVGLSLFTLLIPISAAEAKKGPAPAKAEESPPVETDYPHLIRLRTRAHGDVPRGDEIKILEVRSDRKRIEVGGTYMVKGTYKLTSVPSARLALSMTASGPVGPTYWGRWQTYKIEQGSGTFTLVAKMMYDGEYHVSFYYPTRDGSGSTGRVGVYFY